MSAVSVSHIFKTYDKEKKTALEDISLTVNEGEIFGLIGPDGAGKTSLFRILTTLLLPDSGEATVSGFDIIKDYKTIRKLIGYMPGKFSLYQDLTVLENLNFFATLFGTTLEENYELIKEIYIQIEPFKERRAGKLSGGMKQKLALCCALIHKPKILFLDEPTTGVDPVSRKEFWEMLKRLKAQNISILVSTPYMDEATMCDRIALIQNGKILSLETPQNIIKSYPGPLYKIKSNNMYGLLHDLNSFAGASSCFTFGEYLHVGLVQDDEKAKEELMSYLIEKNHQEINFTKIEPEIEDCFINLLSN